MKNLLIVWLIGIVSALGTYQYFATMPRCEHCNNALIPYARGYNKKLKQIYEDDYCFKCDTVYNFTANDRGDIVSQ